MTTPGSIELATLTGRMDAFAAELVALRMSIEVRNRADDDRNKDTVNRGRTNWTVVMMAVSLSVVIVGALGTLSIAPLWIALDRNTADLRDMREINDRLDERIRTVEIHNGGTR